MNVNPLSETAEFAFCAGCFEFKPKKALSSCSQCKVTQFCSKKCQKAVWKYHKIHCSPPDEAVKSYDKDACIRCIQLDMKKGTPGSKNTAFVLRRLYELLRDHPEAIGYDASQLGYDLHSLTRMPTFVQTPTTDFYSILWAAPGMTNFLLGQHIENVFRMGGVRNYVKYQLFQDSSNEEKSTETFEPDDDHYGSNTCEFSYFLFYILLRTACVQKLAMAEPSTKTLQLRNCLPAKAAAHRAIQMWISPEYSGDSMLGGSEFVKFFFDNHYEEFISCIPIDELTIGCVEDLFCAYNKHSYDILSKLFGVKITNTKRGHPDNQLARKIYHAAKYIIRECEVMTTMIFLVMKKMAHLKKKRSNWHKNSSLFVNTMV